MKTVILICGYRRHGKDTLANIILNGYPNIVAEKLPTKKTIAKMFCISSDGLSPVIKVEKGYERRSFAQSLKLLAADIYNIPQFVSDEEKDIPKFLHPVTKQIVSARDIYIELGSEKRREDKNFWCKQVLSGELKNSIIITDWRFMNEYTYAKEFCDSRGYDLVTIRVFNVDAPIPDRSIETEHDLDEFKTDFVAFSFHKNIDVLDKLTKMFPQYKF